MIPCKIVENGKIEKAWKTEDSKKFVKVFYEKITKKRKPPYETEV